MADYIGSASFANGLTIVSDVPMISGYSRQTLSGDIVSVHLSKWRTQEYETHAVELSFEWEPWATIRKLNWIWGIGQMTYFRADWLSGRCFMKPDKGIYNLKHIFGEGGRVRDYRGTDSDYWSGNIHLLVVQGTIYY